MLGETCSWSFPLHGQIGFFAVASLYPKNFPDTAGICKNSFFHAIFIPLFGRPILPLSPSKIDSCSLKKSHTFCGWNRFSIFLGKSSRKWLLKMSNFVFKSICGQSITKVIYVWCGYDFPAILSIEKKLKNMQLFWDRIFTGRESTVGSFSI